MGAPYTYVSTADTNATLILGNPTRLARVIAINTTGTIYYLKIFNKATAPIAGTDTPVQNYPIPANTSGAGISINVMADLALGLGFCLTSGIALLDSGSAATGLALNFILGHKDGPE